MQDISQISLNVYLLPLSWFQQLIQTYFIMVIGDICWLSAIVLKVLQTKVNLQLHNNFITYEVLDILNEWTSNYQ